MSGSAAAILQKCGKKSKYKTKKGLTQQATEPISEWPASPFLFRKPSYCLLLLLECFQRKATKVHPKGHLLL
jgi:hypothetical protein